MTDKNEEKSVEEMIDGVDHGDTGFDFYFIKTTGDLLRVSKTNDTCEMWRRHLQKWSEEDYYLLQDMIDRQCVIKIKTADDINEVKHLDDLLEEWSVLSPGQWENEEGPKGWYAVCDNSGINAYFLKEKDAFRYRLEKINQALNG